MYKRQAAKCGIAQQTARSWLSLLETSFILFVLPSYHENLGKRVTKSAKLYFYDVGLAAALMGFSQETIIKDRVIFGALFENMVVVDLIKNGTIKQIKPQFSFFRDSNKNEIDIIVEWAKQVMPIEIKASATAQASFFDTLEWFEKLHAVYKKIVIYGGTENQERSRGSLVSWMNIKELLQEI